MKVSDRTLPLIAFVLAVFLSSLPTLAVSEPILEKLDGYWASNSQKCSLINRSIDPSEALKALEWTSDVFFVGFGHMMTGDGDAIIVSAIDHETHFSIRYDWQVAPEVYLLLGVLERDDDLTLFFTVPNEIRRYMRCKL